MSRRKSQLDINEAKSDPGPSIEKKDPENLSEDNDRMADSLEIQSISEENMYQIDSNTEQNDKDNKDDKMDAGEAKQVTFFETLMNCLNSLLSAGILSVPNSFISVGLAPSMVLICFIAFLSYIATIINVKLNQKYDFTVFDELVEKLMGKVGSVLYSIVTIIFFVASMAAYLIIGGDMIISWFSFGGIDISHFKYRAVMILIYALVIPVALTIPKNFRVIGIFSTFSISFIVFYIIASIVKVCEIIPKYGVAPTMEIAHFDIQIFSDLGVYSLIFALPCIIIPLLRPYSKSYKKRRNVVTSSFTICTFLIIFPSILMYLIFGDKADGNILNSFPSNDILFTAVRIGFFIIVSFSFPAIGKSCMCNWSHLLFKIGNANELSIGKFWATFSLTVSIPILLAMFLPQCKPAISVGGAFGGCLGCYFFPSILNILASDKKWTAENIFSGIFAFFGFAIAVVATYTSAFEAIEAFSVH